MEQLKLEIRNSPIIVDSNDIEEQGIVEEAEFSLRFSLARRVCEKPLPASGQSAVVIYELLILSSSQLINSLLEFMSNESFFLGSTLDICTFFEPKFKVYLFLEDYPESSRHYRPCV